MKTEIKKAKLKGRSLVVELEEHIDIEGAGTVTNEVTKSCGNLVHDDLLNAFAKLKVHVVKLCDFKKSELINAYNVEDFDLELLKEYDITGFSLGGNDENAGVTIIGSRSFLPSGKVLNIVVPFTKFEDPNDNYEMASNLAEVIEECRYEVEEYLFNQKCAVKQLEMDFEGEVDADYKVSVLSDEGEAVEVDLKKLKRRSSGRKKVTAESEAA